MKSPLSVHEPDSNGSPILTQSELGKLVRNSAKAQAHQNGQFRNQQQLAAATRNLYNKQQPLQFDQSQFRQQRNYGAEANNFGPVMGAASNGRQNLNSEGSDDDEGSSMGPGFGSNLDGNDNDNDGEGANSDGPTMNLNQAASGYPAQGDYNNDAGLGFGFGAGAEAEFGPSEFGGDGRRAKSASSLTGSRNFGGEEDAGAPQYGPNSAINAGGGDDDEGRAGYAPEGADNDGDDE